MGPAHVQDVRIRICATFPLPPSPLSPSSAESYGGAIAGLPKPLNLSIHLLALMFTIIEELIFGEDGNVVSKTFQKP